MTMDVFIVGFHAGIIVQSSVAVIAVTVPIVGAPTSPHGFPFPFFYIRRWSARFFSFVVVGIMAMGEFAEPSRPHLPRRFHILHHNSA